VSRGGFWRGAALGLLASAAGAVAFHACAPWLGSASAFRAVLLMLGAGAALYALADAQARTGRVVAAMAWVLLLAALLLVDPPLPLWLGALVFGLWLTRSLYRYQSPWQAGADAALGLFALAAATVALRHSQSLFLALWCFFLVQAATAWIPCGPRSTPPPAGDRYDQAQRSAEAALRRLASSR
jgi:hypothetical protein